MQVLSKVDGGQNGGKDAVLLPGTKDTHIALGLSAKDAKTLRNSFPKGVYGHPRVKRTGRSVDL